MIGVVSVSFLAVIGDVVSKIAQAKIKAREGSPGAGADRQEIDALHRRINSLETRLEEREDSIKKLQEEVRFVSRMLEDLSRGT